MPDDQTITVSSKLCFSKILGKNHIRQLKYPELGLTSGDPLCALLEHGKDIELHGRKVLISKIQRQVIPDGFDDALYPSANNRFAWSRKHEIADIKWEQIFARREDTAALLKNKFTFVEEERNSDLSVKKPGLRSPQIGAIYAALGHWRMSSDVGTIVLPTGTGKTDCMIALMAIQRPSCLLVVVPTDALRSQLAEKFMSFGVLVQNGLLPGDVMYPIVGVLKTGFKSHKEIEVFCKACNVIVTTMPLLSKFSELEQKVLASYCGSLFIDEAHHVKAVTWSRLRAQFVGKPILQFTATPYRNDGQHVDGRIIFNYPLRMAQEEGYFNKLVLKELWNYVDIDESVAKAAVEQLASDLDKGLDHIVMARASSIPRAEDLKAIYDGLGRDYLPVVVHSGLKQKELTERLAQLYTRKSRIVVCVSMFGEGFDFPELKIAAVHDIHQSLAVTIQFTGRFTRSNPKVGDATIIVNRANDKIDVSVRELYAEGGGADWNRILTKLTEGATDNQINKQTFYESFASQSPPVAIQNVTPKMSTVVYRMQQNKWQPFNIHELAIADHMYGDLSVSLKEEYRVFRALSGRARRLDRRRRSHEPQL